MRAFTERSPRLLGLIAVLVMAAIVITVIVANRSLFSSSYPIEARFPDAAGITKGTKVTLAGVSVGSVGSVRLDGNAVLATLNINNGVVLPAHTAAAVEVETLLGIEDVALQPKGGWDRPLHSGALITDTSLPVQFYQLQNISGHLLEQSDTQALNQVVEDLANISAGKQQQVQELIAGLNALTSTINQRGEEVGQLIGSGNQVSSALAAQDQNLVSVIDNLSTVTSGLAANSGTLGQLIDNLDQMAGQTNGLVKTDAPQLNSLLGHLHTVLGIVAQHQNDLAEGVAYLGSGIRGFASVGYNGPNNVPGNWANIYVNPATTLQLYNVLGPCGVMDQALNQVLGPDPLACSAQTGPLPGSGTTTQSPASPAPAAAPSGGGGAGSSGSGSSGSGSSGSAPGGGSSGGSALPSAPNQGLGGLVQLFSPLGVGGT